MDSIADSSGSGSELKVLRLHPLNSVEREFILTNFPNGEPVKSLVVHNFFTQIASLALKKLQIAHKVSVLNDTTTVELINARP